MVYALLHILSVYPSVRNITDSGIGAKGFFYYIRFVILRIEQMVHSVLGLLLCGHKIY